MVRKLKLIGSFALVAVLVLFVVQNTEVLNLEFLF